VTRETWTAAGLTAGLVVLEAAIGHAAHAPLGAFAVAGVAGSLILGAGAKALGAWLQRPASDEASGDRWEDRP
jgi:hypothetical protein